ncbi:MAG: HNH endonuclease [Acidobacteriia bacterium]|nr:HNH endonuclease [Terriglobia bacterium]
MRLYVGITDYDWFWYLKALQPDEVNFWQPGGSRQFRTLEPGGPFLFQLHSPRNFIVGGGFFAHFSLCPTILAWEAFGVKNGATSLEEMRRRIEKYRPGQSEADENHPIGCIILEQPFFFEQDQWIATADYFGRSYGPGRSFDLRAETGAALWKTVRERVAASAAPRIGEERPMFGDPVPVRPRLGQGSFRVVVTDIYERRCAITRERVLPVLEAAHIKPVKDGGRHETTNGLLLRSDIHRLFDRGYVTVTPDHRFRVSRKLKEDFHNGEEYLQLAGSELWLPRAADDRPNREFLEWHADLVFRG